MKRSLARHLPSFFFLSLLLWGMHLDAARCQSKTLRFGQLSIEDGLPENSVWALCQDQYGFIWMGTQMGLVRYDGKDMKVFNAEFRDDARSIKKVPAVVRALAEDPSGDLWIGCATGELFRFERETEQLLPVLPRHGDSLLQIDHTIISLLVGQQGKLWVGTNGGGLYQFVLSPEREIERETWKVFDRSNADLPGDRIWDIAVGPAGNKWLATDRGLVRIDSKTDTFAVFQSKTDTAYAPYNDFRNIVFDPDGSLWLSSMGGGLVRFDPESSGFCHYLSDPADPFSIYSNFVERIFQDSKGRLWIGYNYKRSPNQLGLFDPKTEKCRAVDFQFLQSLESPFVFQIKDILQDQAGMIWLASHQTGVLTYSEEKNAFHALKHEPNDPNSLNNNSVCFLSESPDGLLWIATTQSGLNRWNTRTGEIVPFQHDPKDPESLCTNRVNCMAYDRNGRMWIGTDRGLCFYDPAEERFERFLPQSDAKSDLNTVLIKYILVDRRKNLWFGTAEGLQFLDPRSGVRKIYRAAPGNLDSLQTNGIDDLFEASDGSLWVGTESDGFYRFDPVREQFRHFDYSPGGDFCEDRGGNIWVGTYNQGLLCIRSTDLQVEQFTRVEGLTHDKVRGILADDSGRLWVGTGRGLSRFDPGTRQFTNYYASDGLPANEFISRAHLKMSDGTLLFGTPRGVLFFHPDSIRSNVSPARIVLTGIDLFGEPLPIQEEGPLSQPAYLTKELHLAYWQNDFGLHFAGLHYQVPERHQYRVRLENYDTDWHHLGNQRYAGYTNIAPGTYFFRVQASNGYGLWKEQEAPLKIVIAPPWWANVWAYALYLVLGGSLLWWGYRYRLRRQLERAEAERVKELEYFKSRFYTNITHEFRTPLTLILGMAEQIKKEPRRWLDRGLDVIERNGQRVLHLVNQLLELSRLEFGAVKLNYQTSDVIPFLDYLVQSFHSMAAAKGVELQFKKETDACVMTFDVDQLSKVISNLLSNAIKFTPKGGRVTVEIASQKAPSGAELLIAVRDTGIGIPSSQLPQIFDRFYQADSRSTRKGEGTGVGLALVRELVKLMEGRVEVSSEEGVGSTFTVHLPVSGQMSKGEVPVLPSKAVPVQPAFESTTELEKKTAAPTSSEDQTIPENLPRALLIEDTPDMIQYLSACLHGKYRIEVAGDGQNGIEKAIRSVPDIIISDVMMPEKDGFEVCNVLKNDERTSHIPIILLTAKADQSSKMQGLSEGADAYLTKPFNQKELEIRLQKLIELRQTLQERYRSLLPLDKPIAESVSPEDAFMERLRRTVRENISDETFGINELSRTLHLSRMQLYRKVRALTGQTVGEVIYAVKLHHARRLLQRGDLRVGEVAYRVGFKDPSFFTKHYKETFGELPSETVQQAGGE